MLYTLTIDDDLYVLSLSHTKADNVEIDEAAINMKYLNAYRFIDNALVLDEEKLAVLIAEADRKSKDNEIAELKKYLNETDYIMAETFESIMALNNPVTFIADFIKILVDFKQQYADALANRKLWRQRIKELEG